MGVILSIHIFRKNQNSLFLTIYDDQMEQLRGIIFAFGRDYRIITEEYQYNQPPKAYLLHGGITGHFCCAFDCISSNARYILPQH